MHAKIRHIHEPSFLQQSSLILLHVPTRLCTPNQAHEADSFPDTGNFGVQGLSKTLTFIPGLTRTSTLRLSWTVVRGLGSYCFEVRRLSLSFVHCCWPVISGVRYIRGYYAVLSAEQTSIEEDQHALPPPSRAFHHNNKGPTLVSPRLLLHTTEAP